MATIRMPSNSSPSPIRRSLTRASGRPSRAVMAWSWTLRSVVAVAAGAAGATVAGRAGAGAAASDGVIGRGRDAATTGGATKGTVAGAGASVVATEAGAGGGWRSATA